MEKIKSWKLISATGKKLKNWLKISKNNGLKINVQGLDALPNFVFKSKNHNAYKSYISQEMVKKRILALIRYILVFLMMIKVSKIIMIF